MLSFLKRKSERSHSAFRHRLCIKLTAIAKRVILAPLKASYDTFSHLLSWSRWTTVVAAVRMLHQIHSVSSQGCTVNHRRNIKVVHLTSYVGVYLDVLFGYDPCRSVTRHSRVSTGCQHCSGRNRGLMVSKRRCSETPLRSVRMRCFL